MRLTVAGRTVAVATFGPFDPARPALVLLHGAGMDHTVWALQARYFAHHGRAVLAPDLPGHGASAGPPLATIEALADWVPALLDAAGLERAALAGHSMGGLAALASAARHPDRIAALALLGAAAAMPVHPALLEAAGTDPACAAALIASWALGPNGQPGGSPAPGGWLVGQAQRLLARAPAGVLHADLAACNTYKGGLAAAAAINCPALVLAGAEDRMTPAKRAAELAAAMPKARLIILSRCGHMLMAEQPDAALDALIGWLAP
jgi:pimeloyl-ACP methyl ester carboxylesterase